MIIRKAKAEDLTYVAQIYSEIHSGEEQGLFFVGWQRGVYPTLATCQAALERDDLFVLEDEDEIVGSAIINKEQVDVYAGGKWEYPTPDDSVMVLHTLTISPQASGKGYGSAFVKFYEKYALEHSCPYLRLDTNERNTNARALYAKLGYKEIGIASCKFNGMPDIKLMLIEKCLKQNL